MKTKKTKYAIWDNGRLVPASKKPFQGSIPLTIRNAEERRLGLRWYDPTVKWSGK